MHSCQFGINWIPDVVFVLVQLLLSLFWPVICVAQCCGECFTYVGSLHEENVPENTLTPVGFPPSSGTLKCDTILRWQLLETRITLCAPPSVGCWQLKHIWSVTCAWEIGMMLELRYWEQKVGLILGRALSWILLSWRASFSAKSLLLSIPSDFVIAAVRFTLFPIRKCGISSSSSSLVPDLQPMS